MGWLASLASRYLGPRVRAILSPADLGQRGEDVAAKHLKRLGYKIVAQRRRTRLGELDLVAVDGRTVVFVEVKSRRDDSGGGPLAAVDEEKQARIARAALGYLKRHDLLEYAARFDVVAVIWPAGARTPQVEHIINAFTPPGEGQMFS